MDFAGVTNEQMAAELGVTRQTISRWINTPEAPIEATQLRQWARRCRVDAGWLLSGLPAAMPPLTQPELDDLFDEMESRAERGGIESAIGLLVGPVWHRSVVSADHPDYRDAVGSEGAWRTQITPGYYSPVATVTGLELCDAA